MGLAFLTPAFLLGLFAVAVPVLVHLVQRQRRDAVPFPSLMFLQRIPIRETRRRRVRHPLLLAARCLGVLLLAVAFARPLLPDATRVATPLAGAREVVLLLDRSYSMGHGDRWPRALMAARQVIDGLGEEDHASLLAFGGTVEEVVASTSDRARLRGALEAVRLGAGPTRYAPALKAAQERLQATPRPRHEVVLVSDFQKVGWQDEGPEDLRLPEATTFNPVDVAGSDFDNTAVAGVVLGREYASGRERITVSARLVHKGRALRRDLAVSLEMDGRAVETRTLTLEPNASATVAFGPVALPPATTRASVRAAVDALPQDDAFHFLIAPGREVSVLVLEAGGARPQASLFVRRALEIGDRPRFRVEVKPLGALRAEDLASRAAVVLNDTALPPATAGHLLRSFVERGGGLLAALGDRGGAGAGAFWSPSAPIDRGEGSGGTLAFLDYTHPVFEAFKGPRGGDFTSARFLRYRGLKDESSWRILARFDDGTVALAEQPLGRGRLMVWTATLDTLWSDLPLKPVFLPFVHQLMKHVAAYAPPPPWREVGQVLDVAEEASSGDGPAAEVRVVMPSGRTLRVPASGEGRFLTLEEAGFFELRRGAEPTGRPVAVNVDVRESDLSVLNHEEVAAALTRGPEGRERRATVDRDATPEESQSRQAWSWRLLVLALALLTTEAWVANRLSRVGSVGQPNEGAAP